MQQSDFDSNYVKLLWKDSISFTEKASAEPISQSSSNISHRA